MKFEELIEKTKKLNAKFPNNWDKRDRMLDLVEEVGELSQAMQIVDRRKWTNDPKKQRTSEDIADAVCDVLYDLILLARDYKIDLPKEYEAMLRRLEKRVRSGEFDERKAVK